MIWSTDNWRPSGLACSVTTGSALTKILQENNQAILVATPEAGNQLYEASKLGSLPGQLLMKGYSGDRVEIGRFTEQSVILNQTESECLKLRPRSPALRSFQTRSLGFEYPASEDSALRWEPPK